MKFHQGVRAGKTHFKVFRRYIAMNFLKGLSLRKLEIFFNTFLIISTLNFYNTLFSNFDGELQ